MEKVNANCLLVRKGEQVTPEMCEYNARRTSDNTGPFLPTTYIGKDSSFYNNGWPGFTGPPGNRVATSDLWLLLPTYLVDKYSGPQFNEYGEIAP